MTTAQAAKPAKQIRLADGKVYTVVLDMNAFWLLEEALEASGKGRNLFKAINWNDLNFREFTMVVWGALLSNHPDMTLEQVRQIVTPNLFEELRPVIDSMLQSSMPQPEPLKEGEEYVDEKKAIATATKE